MRWAALSTSRIDPVAALLGGAVIGAAAGGTITAGALALFYQLRTAADSGFGRIALLSALVGLGTSALIGLLIARPAGGMRGVMAACAAFAGAFFFIVLTTYADRVAGRNGLVLLTVLCAAIVAGAWMLFLRHPTPDTSS